MRLMHKVWAGVLWCAIGGLAAAQTHLAFELDVEDPEGAQKVDTAIAVSTMRVLVATNQRLQLFDRSGNLLDEEIVQDTENFPFKATVATSALFDPRVEYDSVNDRLWMMYTERAATGVVHLAVSKEDVTPQDLSPTYWHYWTGAEAFDLASDAIEPDTLRFDALADHPTISIDANYLYMVALDYYSPVLPPPDPDLRDVIVIFPLSHGAGSMLSGARPSEGELDILQIKDVAFFDPIDDGYHHYAVQEPHEQEPSVQFFLCTPEPAGPGPVTPRFPTYDGVQTGVRLGAAYRAGGEWKYQWEDVPMPSSANYYFNAKLNDFTPATPDLQWKPNTLSSIIESGVLAKDTIGRFRIFAGQHVLVAEGTPPEAVDHTEFRWYVIDPDLAHFPGSEWAPQIEVVGVAPAGSVAGGETHQGVITVNELGTAWVTYTKSGPEHPGGWPSLYRARLSASYSGTLFEQLVQAGPHVRWSELSNSLGGDFADIQADPVHCGVWSVGTLVADPGDAPAPSDVRAIWFTETPASCNNAEMNGDGSVDEADLLIYSEYHAVGDPLADMNRDGKMDAFDYARYLDEYAKRPK